MVRASYCLPVTLAYLFLASVAPSMAQKGAEAEEGEGLVRVAEGAPLEVECRLRPEQRAEWKLEGAAPPADLRPQPEAAAADGRLAARLLAPAARPHHAGLYTCSADGRRGPRVRVALLPPTERPAPDAAEEPEEAEQPEEPAAGDSAEAKEVLYDVRTNITLACTLPNDKSLPYVWTKNSTNVEEVVDLRDRYETEKNGAEFLIKRSVEDDFGNYSCSLKGAEDAGQQSWVVSGRTYAKLPPNSNVVEGQKLKLQCKVLGKPYPRVVWTFSNDTEAENGTEVRLALGEGRVRLNSSVGGAPDDVLVLEAAQRADAGRYWCAAPRAGRAANAAATTLHVKDQYAALWPFLGICAEVFVLCAIILLYEKRRTKPDLDDSDTDNHDQKKS